MKVFQKVFRAGMLCGLLAVMPLSAVAETVEDDSPRQIITLLKEQNSKLSGELRRIHREIAALRVDLEKPGFKDIFAGIGYIFGLFGVAAFAASRRKE